MDPGQQVGPFTIERELGYGAMGAVYLARYKGRQRVALKFIAAGAAANPRTFERFEREAEILKQLKHPNIVRLFGHGRHKKLPYYAMEYVEGQTLLDVLQQRTRLPWEEVVRLGKQLCAALQHAHEKGIIHRDLKPSNLMVLADGTLKLTDFGIAKDLDVTQLTSANCTVGTASYMSPEQCKGERDLTHKSDLYSLGIVFYELLTGHKPFDADNAMDMFLQHVNGKFERPSRLVMDIPPWLDTLICQLLEKKPGNRPFDAAVVAAALEQVVEKVTAQQSAGVDALTGATATARLATRTLAGKDKEAARTLAQGLGKTKKKRKKPFFKRAWVQAAGLVLAMVVVGGLIFIAAMPPSPDALYDEAKRLMDSGDPAKRDRAYDGPLEKYLRYHGKRTDRPEQLEQVRAWVDEIATKHREDALLKRMKIGIEPRKDWAESASRQAIHQEEAGEFNDAVATWEGLLKYETQPDETGDRVAALVAKRRLHDLKSADERLRALLPKVDDIRDGKDRKADSESEALAIEAERYEQLGDAAMAARRWQALKLKNEKEGGDHVWFLLAARGAKEQKAKAPNAADERSERRKLLKARLDAARQLADEGKKDKARPMVYEIIQLYEDSGDAQDEVDRAKKLRDELRPT